MTNLATYGEMLATAVRDPQQVPSYLRQHATRAVTIPARVAATHGRLHGLPRQQARLDHLRAGSDWLLVVLDACRYDALTAVFDDYFEGECQPVASAGRDTFEYVRTCWPDEYHDITYVSGAVPVHGQADFTFDDAFQALYDGYVPGDHLHDIRDVWATAWDASIGVCPPEAVTAAALDAATESSRVVAHYFQPHTPYIGDELELGHTDDVSAEPGKGEPVDVPIWERVRDGRLSDSRLRELYDANLARVLRAVCQLVDATTFERVVVMGDHGEALGEYNVYAHPRVAHPNIRVVPWAEVEGVDGGFDTSSPRGSRDESASGNVRARLEELGYL